MVQTKLMLWLLSFWWLLYGFDPLKNREAESPGLLDDHQQVELTWFYKSSVLYKLSHRKNSKEAAKAEWKNKAKQKNHACWFETRWLVVSVRLHFFSCVCDQKWFPLCEYSAGEKKRRHACETLDCLRYFHVAFFSFFFFFFITRLQPMQLNSASAHISPALPPAACGRLSAVLLLQITNYGQDSCHIFYLRSDSSFLESWGEDSNYIYSMLRSIFQSFNQ